MVTTHIVAVLADLHAAIGCDAPFEVLLGGVFITATLLGSIYYFSYFEAEPFGTAEGILAALLGDGNLIARPGEEAEGVPRVHRGA